MSSWVEGAAGSPYDVDNLPYGVFSTAARRHRGSASASATSCSTWRRSPRPQQPELAARLRGAVAQRDHGHRTPDLDLAARLVHAAAHRRGRARPRGAAPGPGRPRSRCTCRSRSPTTSTSTARCSTRPTSAGSSGPTARRCCPTGGTCPVGYHGRAGTVVVSGTPVVRPHGQRKPADADAPVFGPSQRLDIEAEVGFVVGAPAGSGRLAADDAPDHVFGASCSTTGLPATSRPGSTSRSARSSASRSPPRSPAGSRRSTALDAARVDLPGRTRRRWTTCASTARPGYDIAIEVLLNGEVVSRPPYAAMYWSPAQMLAHMTSNGASLRTGDLFASGTVSGDERDQRGSFLELSWGGTRAVHRRWPRAHLPRGRRRGHAPRHRPRRPRRPDRARRGDRDRSEPCRVKPRPPGCDIT